MGEQERQILELIGEGLTNRQICVRRRQGRSLLSADPAPDVSVSVTIRALRPFLGRTCGPAAATSGPVILERWMYE
jgi:hypothetical protein